MSVPIDRQDYSGGFDPYQPLAMSGKSSIMFQVNDGTNDSNTVVFNVNTVTPRVDIATPNFYINGVIYSGGGTGTYLPLAGGTMAGTINMNNNTISNLPPAALSGDAVSLSYLSLELANYLLLNGTSSMTGSLNVGGHSVINMANPVNPTDAVTLTYLQSQLLNYLPSSGGTIGGALTVTSGISTNTISAYSGSQINFDNNLYPGADNAYVIGATSSRVEAMYLSQLIQYNRVNNATLNGIRFDTGNTYVTQYSCFSYGDLIVSGDLWSSAYNYYPDTSGNPVFHNALQTCSVFSQGEQYFYFGWNSAVATIPKEKLFIGYQGTSDQVSPGADNSMYLGTSTNRYAYVYSAGGVITTSDANHKKNIKAIDNKESLSFVNSLSPVSFQWKTGPNTECTNYGFCAQDLLKSLNKHITSPDHGGFIHIPKKDEPYGINFDHLLPFFAGSIQSLTSQIDELKKEITSLKAIIR